MAKLDVDTSLIETLAELLLRTGLTEIEVAEGDSRIRVARQIHASFGLAGLQTVAAQGPVATVEPEPRGAPVDASHPGAVTSPMVGTAYLQPEPDVAPFVSVGGEVKEGQTLLIIEAMKVMNPIRAPRSGRISQIFVGNAAPVEYGEVLMIIE